MLINSIRYFVSILILIISSIFAQDYLNHAQQQIAGQDCYRITKSLTQSELGRKVFGSPKSLEWVRIVNYSGQEFSIALTTDTGWNRLVFSDYDKWIRSYGDNSGDMQFNRPMGLTRARWAEKSGSAYAVPIYVADSGNNRVVELLLVMVDLGVGTSTSIQFRREFAGINSPTDVAYLSHPTSKDPDDGILWVSETGDHRLVEIDLTDGSVIDRYGSYGGGSSQFISPTYIATDKDGDGTSESVFVVDRGNERIVKFKPFHIHSGGGTETKFSSSGGGILIWQKEIPFIQHKFCGINSDPFGGLWAIDEANHSLVRFDSGLNKLFSNGSHGLGQVAHKMNGPIDVSRYFRNVFSNNTQTIDLTDLSFVTERWGANSGQLRFQSIPKMIFGTFSYEHIYEGGGGPIEPLVPQPPSDWWGTDFTFISSDAARISLNIYNHNDTEHVKTVYANKYYPPGEIASFWNGIDKNGAKYTRCNYYVRITFDSMYDYPNPYTRLFNVTIPNCGGSLLPEIAKESSKSDLTFQIFPNYPNPFNGTTNLRFQIPSKGDVNLQIYNVLGQRIKTIFDDNLVPGTYTMQWNGTNGANSFVGSGVYFVILIYEDNGKTYIDHQKILFLE